MAAESGVKALAATSAGVVVPFREDYTGKRTEQLAQFQQWARGFLSDVYRVYIIEQSKDGRLFNRGALLNVGIQQAIKDGCDAIITHDVDLTSSDDMKGAYAWRGHALLHIARRWPRYAGNRKYLGGIVSASHTTWMRLNGYPNSFWGWGGEDDALYRRKTTLGIHTLMPLHGTVTDLESMDVGEKLVSLRASGTKNMSKWEGLEADAKGWRHDGLNSVKYVEQERTVREGSPVFIHLKVELKC